MTAHFGTSMNVAMHGMHEHAVALIPPVTSRVRP